MLGWFRGCLFLAFFFGINLRVFDVMHGLFRVYLQSVEGRNEVHVGIQVVYIKSDR